MTFGPSASRSRVVLVGGGVAGLEALMALSALAEDRVDITLVSPDPDFVYKPMLVGEPFGAGEAERRALEPIAAEFGAEFVERAVSLVDSARSRVLIGDGEELAFDSLFVAVGARPRPAFEHALTFGPGGDPTALGGMLTQLPRDSAHVAFVVPPGVAWSLPLYELALMSRRRLDELGARDVRLTIVSPEERPLALFGPVPSAAVEELLSSRAIDFMGSARPRETEPGVLDVGPGRDPLTCDTLVALPRLIGPGLAGLPADADGFIAIDEACRVEGLDNVWAAGDGTTFPVKQGGIATQQADTAAEQIAARAGAPLEPQPFRPVLRGMLLLGDESVYARHELIGTDEGSASLDHLWWPPHKIGGRYLSAWLEHAVPRQDLSPPVRPIEVEVALPHEWHGSPL